MAVQDEERIVADPDVLGGKPRIADTRIGVHFLARRIEAAGDEPEAVADEFDLDLGDVYLALAYYHNNPDEMRAIERRRERAREATDTLTPPDTED